MNVKKIGKGELSLTTKGELSIFFIGAGSAFTKRFFQNNIIIMKGEDHLLVDCGTLCSYSLHTIGAKITPFRNIFLTHIHADHTGGMEEVFLMNRYMTKKKPLLIVDKDFSKILWNETLKGGSGYSEKVGDRILNIEDFVDVIDPNHIVVEERDCLAFKVGELDFIAPRTKHIPDSAKTWREAMLSYALLIDQRILFTSDTMFDPELILSFDKKYNLEYIFHDCQLFTGGVHSSIDELITLPPEIKKKMILMHYGDNRELNEDKMKKGGFHSWAEMHHLYSF